MQTTASGSYSWSGPNGFTSTLQNPTITNATSAKAGNYTLVVTNNNGCSASATTNVVVNANPTIELGANQTICNGTSTTLDAGAGYNYLWSNNATTQTISVGAGNYSVTVYNNNECSATDNIVVNNYPQTTLTVSSTAETGDNENDGSATVTATGTSPYSYTWSNNAHTATINGLSGGNYSVTVTDGNGCVYTTSVNVATLDTPPVADFTADDNTVCLGQEIAFTDASTNAPTSWSWNFGDGTTSNVQNPRHTYSAAGTYSVSLTVTNADGTDTEQKSGFVVVYSIPTLEVSNNGGYCVGETIELFAQTNANTYSWSGPMGFNSNQQNPTRQNSNTNHSGNYYVTVTSAEGCSTNGSTNVVVNANPNATITNNSNTNIITCTQSSISLTANGGTSYQWSNGQTTQNISVTSAGEYSVIVTDANGCSANSETITINADANVPTVTISGNEAYCEGETINLSAVCANATSYSWTGPNGFTSQNANITVSDAGNYEVEVTSSNGCTANDQFNVVINSLPTAEVSDIQVCEGNSINLSADCNENVTYSWSGPNGFTSSEVSPVIENATLQSAGTYNLNIENANGCENSYSFNVIVNANPTINLGNDITICENTSATLEAPAGFNSYTWNNGSTTQTISVSETGTYSVVVTNAQGCTASDEIVVNHWELPELTMSSTPESGSGMNDGTATVEITGGASPYAILWNNNATTTQITGLTNGIYTVEVTDAHGCVANGSVTVNALNTPPQAIFNADVTEGCAPLTVNFTDNSLNNPITWSWNFDGTNTSNEQNPTFTFNNAGTYTVTLSVSNNDGNDEQTMTINVYENPTVTLTTNNSCNSVEISATSNIENISYLWNNGETTNNIVVTEAGDYSVTVTSEHGCATSSSITIDAIPQLTIDLGEDISACSNETTEITAPDGFESYLWNDGSTTQTITVSETGTYSVVVTDANECTASDEINVTIFEAPEYTLADTITANINEQIVITPTVSESVSVIWNNEEEANSYTQTYPYVGEYMVFVTFSNENCEVTDTVFVIIENSTSIENIESAIKVDLYPNPAHDFATFTISEYNGKLTYSIIDISGKEISYETIWVENETLQTFEVSNLAPGMYMLRLITDDGIHNLKFNKD